MAIRVNENDRQRGKRGIERERARERLLQPQPDPVANQYSTLLPSHQTTYIHTTVIVVKSNVTSVYFSCL